MTQVFSQYKVSQSEIARCLGRDRSTIHREIKRNFWHDKEYPLAEGYWHVFAHVDCIAISTADSHWSPACRMGSSFCLMFISDTLLAVIQMYTQS